jgi:hypothetical protein
MTSFRSLASLSAFRDLTFTLAALLVPATDCMSQRYPLNFVPFALAAGKSDFVRAEMTEGSCSAIAAMMCPCLRKVVELIFPQFRIGAQV